MIATLATLVLAATPASSTSTDMPRPLPGLWNIDAVLINGQQAKARMCIGSGVPAAWKEFEAKLDPTCKVSRQRDGGEFRVEAVCKLTINKVISSTHMRMTAGERLMHMTMDIDGKGFGLSSPGHMEATYSYNGPCPATLKEGQMQQSDGTIIDLSGGGAQPAPTSPPGGA